MHGWLKKDYPEQADYLLQLCVDDSGEKPLLFEQVELAIDYFDRDRNRFSTELTEALLSTYLYFVAALFCLDAIVDGHPRGLNNDIKTSDLAKSMTLFIAGGLTRLNKFLSLGNINNYDMQHRIFSLFNEHILALNLEEKSFNNLENIEPRSDYKNIIGRANLCLFMFEIVALACRTQVSQKFVNTFNEFLYFTQLGDDISDWRSDFEHGQYTSFLKQSISKFENIPALYELEQYIYLSGIYESWLAQIVIGLDAVIGDFNSISRTDTLLMKYIVSKRDSAKQTLASFINEKKVFCEV